MKHDEWIFEIHETLPSTSDRCFDYISAGREGVFALIAHRQTLGRGTHQRSWQTPSGNLAFSFTLKSDFPSHNPFFAFSDSQDFLQALPYMIGIAVYEVLIKILPHEAHPYLFLKWPNDLLWKERKISGILIESVFEGDSAHIVVGIGLNIAQSPKIPGRVLTSLCEAGASLIAPEILAKKILTEAQKWFSCWKRGKFPVIREAWLLRSTPLGTILKLGVGEAPLEGKFAGITDLGHLMLEDDSGRIKNFVTTEMRL